MRESVIFEIVNDSIQFNYKGDNNSLDLIAFEIDQLYRLDYQSFIKKIDIQKLKGVLKIGLLINDEHPFSDINLHWYYNLKHPLIFVRSIEFLLYCCFFLGLNVEL